MSGTLNKVMLIGHLGDEVKMHYFEGGGCVGRFPLATNETYVSKQTNERVTNTDWHNIVVRNKGAEICEKYLSKGDKVYIEGRLKTRKWQDEKGNDRYSTEIQCSDFTFLSTKKESESNANNAATQQKPAATSPQPASKPIEDADDDLPF
ncbi:single-stranded DNA-binding protein [Algibacter lectus]|uniref:Single-stranded DNA-binding protein n=1 Tax=Algibacter lectus TaxID=221126 RepID=A0A090WP18_9FLAO|nr:single-stranded DNA-binding protein [Algibacter lectus]GAL60864.1 single-stranded DNA-binding protein [Algibacter lectus]GAL78756.1 single-stranded DNA-binding protein [Algibacter lectus]